MLKAPHAFYATGPCCLHSSLVFRLRSLQCPLTPILTLNDFIFQFFLFVHRDFAYFHSSIQECVVNWNFAFSSAMNDDILSRRTIRFD